MGIIVYLARGISLLWCLISPGHRSKTVARWKAARPHHNVYEIGTGIIGLVIIGGLMVVIVQRAMWAWAANEP